MHNVPFVFFGTSDFAVSVLDALHAMGIKPRLIVTETDKPKGRGLSIAPPHVKQWALKHGIEIYQPETLKTSDTTARLMRENADVFLVAEYGKLIPESMLAIPRFGTLNIHPSLLPKYRGPSPIQSAILADDNHGGVTLIELDAEMDHGPILASKERVFSPWPPTYTVAADALAKDGAELFAKILGTLSDITQKTPQDHAQATYTKKFSKTDGLIDLSADGYRNWLTFQALSKHPGVYAEVKKTGNPLRIRISDAQYSEGSFSPTKVIPPGKKEMPYEDFLRGL